MTVQCGTPGQLRTDGGLTPEALAGRSGLSKSFLWTVEKDRADISVQRLCRPADALNTPPEFFFGRGEVEAERESPSVGTPRFLGELARSWIAATGRRGY